MSEQITMGTMPVKIMTHMIDATHQQKKHSRDFFYIFLSVVGCMLRQGSPVSWQPWV